MDSLFWTDVTHDNIELPDIDVSETLGLLSDTSPRQPRPWPGVQNCLDVSFCHQDDLQGGDPPTVEELTAENAKLQHHLNDAKKLLSLFNKQNAELKAARKRLVSVEVEKKQLFEKVRALKTLISELESDASKKRRRTETDSIPINREDATSSLGSPTLACLYCKHSSVESADPFKQPPLLDEHQLERFLTANDPLQIEHLSQSYEVRELTRLQISNVHFLKSVEQAGAVFGRVLLNEGTAGSGEKVLKTLAILSSTHSQLTQSLSLHHVVLQHINTAMADPHAPDPIKAICIQLLFQGRWLNLWDAKLPIITLAQHILTNIAHRETLPFVHKFARSDVTGVLEQRHDDDLLNALSETILVVIRHLSHSSAKTDYRNPSGLEISKRSEESLKHRCNRIISSSQPTNESRRMAATALSLECCLLPASISYESILTTCLWDVLPSAISNPDRFISLLSYLGCVGSYVAKDSSELMSRAVDASVDRLLVILDEPLVLPPIRAATLDAVVSIALKGGQRIQDRIYHSLEMWAQHLGSSEDVALISQQSKTYMEERHLLPPVSSICDAL